MPLIVKANMQWMLKWTLTIPSGLPIYLPTYLPTYQPTYLPTYLPTNQPTYQPTNLPTYQPTIAIQKLTIKKSSILRCFNIVQDNRELLLTDINIDVGHLETNLNRSMGETALSPARTQFQKQIFV